MKAMQGTVSERVVIKEGEHVEVELVFRGADEEDGVVEGLVRVEGEVREAGEEGLEGDAALEAGEGGAQAKWLPWPRARWPWDNSHWGLRGPGCVCGS